MESETNTFERNVERLFKSNTKRELAEKLESANARHAFMAKSFDNLQTLHNATNRKLKKTVDELTAAEHKVRDACTLIGAMTLGVSRSQIKVENMLDIPPAEGQVFRHFKGDDDE